MLKRNKLGTYRGLIIGLVLVSALSLTSFNVEETDRALYAPIKTLQEPITAKEVIEAQTIETPKIYLPFVAKIPPLNHFGTQIYGSLDANNDRLDALVGLPATWVRKPLSWSTLEPNDTTPENYQWGGTDTTFLNAHNNNLKVIATIDRNPAWAATNGGGPVKPEHEEDLLEFVAAIVERYDADGVDDAPGSPKVEYFEFYNEPDNTSPTAGNQGFGYWGQRGDEYAQLLATVRPAMKNASADVKILMGGIAHDNFLDEGLGVFERAFLDDFLSAGGANYIDFFNFHYYPAFAAKWAQYGIDLHGKTNFMRIKMAQYGTVKPIMITEIGFPSNVPAGGTEETQSRYVMQAYTRGLAADIKAMIWFALEDLPITLHFFGLTYSDFTPKPSYLAYQTAIQRLSGAKYVRTLSITELGADQGEGYVFTKDGSTIYTVWTNDGGNGEIRIPASRLDRVSKYGSILTIFDGDDSTNDGLVIIDYAGDPIYLVVAP